MYIFAIALRDARYLISSSPKFILVARPDIVWLAQPRAIIKKARQEVVLSSISPVERRAWVAFSRALDIVGYQKFILCSNDATISLISALLMYGCIVDSLTFIGWRDCSKWKIETYICRRDGKTSKCGH